MTTSTEHADQPEHREHPDHTHVHGADCGHQAVDHDGHVDYLHDGHRHAVHDGHVDDH